MRMVIALILALAATAHAAEGATPQAAAGKPNIVYIMADDLGYGDLGCYGQKHIQTPHIDALARESLKFTDVYAGASVCAPSRSVLMTGQHLGHTRVRGNSGIIGGIGQQRRVPLEPGDVTVAEVLKAAGYATGLFGKWGLGEPDSVGEPRKQGFDESYGYLNQQHAHTYYTDHLYDNGQRVELEGNKDGKTTQYSAELIAERGLKFIRDHRDRPFFLYAAWTLPHGKYVIPSLGAYESRDWSHDYKVHAAMVTMLDRHVGQVLALLKELNLEKNTLVFFCSDNGAVERREGVLDSHGGWRGNKGNQYEGGLRTPMLVRWPGRVPAGKLSDAPWYFADVLPTLAEVAGVSAPANVDGVSVLPTLLGKSQPELRERMMYWEQYSGGFQQAVRWGKWKMLRFAKGNKVELYDLTTDRMEANNVASAHPDVVAKIAAFMDASHIPSPNWPKEPLANTRKKSKESK